VQTVAELQARLRAERAGVPFIQFRDGEGSLQIVSLPPDAAEAAIGRSAEPGIRLAWDQQISRVHALLQRVGGLWTVVDDGMSRNGTYVNATRLAGRRVLVDGDAIRCGGVILEFRDPGAAADLETLKDSGDPAAPHISPAQRRVLIALCRPLLDSPTGLPATNKQIAAELTLSVEAVKTHLRRISEVLEIRDLPQNEKRAMLARQAINSGVISVRELLAEL
jgi:hypothetical protein